MLGLGSTLILSLATANAYVWPSPQLDALDALRFDQQGHNRLVITRFLEPCESFIFSSSPTTGRANTPDWIRTAYHDIATHNVEDGTGGMDASIRFFEEKTRPENAGDGFDNTMSALLGMSNRYISIADALAVGLVIAVETCGGPEIAFRAGRVDAKEPNTPGVPQPQQDLQSHIDSFARQGFTPTEMIGLVACGHTFGGVQHTPFPDIVPELHDPNSTKDVAHFDTTFVHFDNNVATEYISGTTTNPLVVGFNETTNSDKRIFASDGNITMQSFADSPELFKSTCADLFARMIDTVPHGVQLTDVLVPLPIKPSGVELTLDGDTLKLSGEVRLWNTTEDPNRTVRLLWDDHVGGANNVTLSASGVSSAIGGLYSAAWYAFHTTTDAFLSLDAAAGITNMRFVINDKLEDQGGVGFTVQDAVVLSKTTCVSVLFPLAGHLEVAVRNGVTATRVYIEQEKRDLNSLPIVVETDLAPSAEPTPANASYSLWTIDLAHFDQFSGGLGTHTIGAEVDGVKISVGNKHNEFDFPSCPK
ncbi:putative L-ascorbate oxidase [Mycena crocata]|nr:putative L-ascorbate oxidase [Mycena crocata]